MERFQRENRLSSPTCTHISPNLTRANPWNANLTALQLRNEDSYDQRQSLAAAEVSRSYQSAEEKRIDHNNNYIGHWPREKRDGHKKAVKFARDEAVLYGEESRRHRDVRRLVPFWGSLANLGSPVMIAGGTKCRRTWMNTSRKRMTEAFRRFSCAFNSETFP